MNSLNIFNEESNEPIDLMDSLHVMLSSDHKELDGTTIKKISGNNIDEVEIILSGIEQFAGERQTVNDIVNIRFKQIKEEGLYIGFKDDVEVLLFCINSKAKKIRLLALSIIKQFFQLEVGWNADDLDEQRYHALCMGFATKGPRIITDLLVQNYADETDLLLEIIVFSSAHLYIRRQYIDLILKPLMLYVVPANVLHHRILALTALKHCMLQIEQPCTAFTVQGPHVQDIWEIVDSSSGSHSPFFCCRVCTFSCWKYGSKQYRGQLFMTCECSTRQKKCLHVPNQGAERAFGQNVLAAFAHTFSKPETSIELYIAACDLITAAADSKVVDITGIGLCNFNEHGKKIPMSPLSMAKNRREIIINYEVGLNYPHQLQSHLLVDSTNVLQILFWLTKLPVDMETRAPWTSKLPKDKLPFPWCLHQAAINSSELRSSATRALWTLASHDSSVSQFFLPVRHQHIQSWSNNNRTSEAKLGNDEDEESGIEDDESSSDDEIHEDRHKKQNNLDGNNSDASSEDNFDKTFDDEDLAFHKKEVEKYKSQSKEIIENIDDEDIKMKSNEDDAAPPDFDTEKRISVSQILKSHNKVAKNIISPPFIFVKLIKMRSKTTGILDNAFAVYLKAANGNIIRNAVGHYAKTTAFFYTVDGSEPLWEFQNLHEEETKKQIVPNLTTRLYTGNPIKFTKHGWVTIKAVAVEVPSHWTGLQDEIDRVFHGRMECRLGKQSKITFKKKYLKASLARNKTRFKSAMKRLSIMGHFKLLGKTASIRGEKMKGKGKTNDLDDNDDGDESDDPDHFHNIAEDEMKKRFQEILKKKKEGVIEDTSNNNKIVDGAQKEVTIIDSLLANIEDDIDGEAALYAVMTLIEAASRSPADMVVLNSFTLIRSHHLADYIISRVKAVVRHGHAIPSAKSLATKEDGEDHTIDEATSGLSREFGAGTITPMLTKIEEDMGRSSQRHVSQMFLRTTSALLYRSNDILRAYVHLMTRPMLSILQQTPIGVVRKDIITAFGFIGLCAYDDILKYVVSHGVIRYILIEARCLYSENHTRSRRGRADGDLLKACVRTLTIYSSQDCLKDEFRKSGGLIDKEACISSAWEIEEDNPDFGYYLPRFFRQILRRRQNLLIDELEHLATLGAASLLSSKSKLVSEYVRAELDKKKRSPATVLTLVGSQKANDDVDSSSSDEDDAEEKIIPLYEMSSENDYAVDLESIVLVVENVLKQNEKLMHWMALAAVATIAKYANIRHRIVNNKMIMTFVNNYLTKAVRHPVGTLIFPVSCITNACSVVCHLTKAPHDIVLWLKFESQKRLILDSSGNPAIIPAIKEGSKPLHIKHSDDSVSKIDDPNKSSFMLDNNTKKGGNIQARDNQSNTSNSTNNKSNYYNEESLVKKESNWGIKFHHGDSIILSTKGIKLPNEFTISVWIRGGKWLKKGQIYTLIQSINGDKIICTDEKGRIGTLRAGTVDGDDLFAKWYCPGVSLIKEMESTPDKNSVSNSRVNKSVEEDMSKPEWHHLCMMGYSRQRSDQLADQPVCDFFLNGKKIGATILNYRPTSKILCIGNTYDGGEAWGPLADFRLYPQAFGDNLKRWPEHLRLTPPLKPFPKIKGFIVPTNVLGGEAYLEGNNSDNDEEELKTRSNKGNDKTVEGEDIEHKFHNDRILLNYREKLEYVRSKVLSNNCIPNIIPLLSSPSVKTRILACEAISNIALYAPGRSLLIAQWVYKTEERNKINAYEMERANLQEKIMNYNGIIETLQLQVLSKSDNKKEMAHDMDLLKEYQKTMSVLQKRVAQLKNNQEFEKMMSRKRLIDSLFYTSSFDTSKEVRRWASSAILNMY